MSGLAADLGTLLSPSPPSPPDISFRGASSSGAVAHRGLLWARVPALREQLLSPSRSGPSDDDGPWTVELPEGIGEATLGLALQWAYRGELPRMDEEPLTVDAMRELLALAEAWELPELALQGQRAPAVLQSGGLLGVARPQTQALCDDLGAAFGSPDGTSAFFDIVLELQQPDDPLLEGEPEPEPEPESHVDADVEPAREDSAPPLPEPLLCRGNRAVLCCRSGFFRAMLCPANGCSWSETRAASSRDNGGTIKLSLPFRAENFAVVNRFLHTGEISLESVDELRFAVELADYFDIAALHERCGDWIIEALAVETACSLWNGRVPAAVVPAAQGDRDVLVLPGGETPVPLTSGDACGRA
jgi:hypothetical protein